MDRTLQGYPLTERQSRCVPLVRWIVWGFAGGLAGTLVMDILLMGALPILGLPALTCFSIVGNTVARFFSVQSMDMADAIRLGIATHYLVGPLFGTIFGMLVARVEALQVNTLKKSIILAIFYIEILSQPILATTPILLKMDAPATLQWYGGAIAMHLIMSIVLGVIVGVGLRLHATATPRRSQ